MNPFVGPAYQLALRKAAIDDSVNCYLQGMETPGKAPWIMKAVDGLREFADLGAPLRGVLEVGTRTFAVAGPTVYELDSSGTATSRGTLSTSSGAVSMAYGLSQLVIADGVVNVLTLSTNALTVTTHAADTVDFADNYFVFTQDRDGQQFEISEINDATDIDALDFASAEGSPDKLVGHIALQPGVLMMGTLTGELFINTGAADFPFERSRGSGFSVGLMARGSLKRIDNGCMWIGRDETGAGIVYKLAGGQPQRVSTAAIEEALQASTDLTAAVAYAYQKHGLTFYCVNAPGTSTWCYEIASGAWHRRCDLDDAGQFEADRGVCHAFAFGEHLIGGSDGKVYALDASVYTKAGDPLVVMRRSPHQSVPSLKRQTFDAFHLDCETGGAGQGIAPVVELSWSDDSGATWSNPLPASTGLVGERFQRLTWKRLGQSRDRVWQLKHSDNAPFAIVNVFVETRTE